MLTALTLLAANTDKTVPLGTIQPLPSNKFAPTDLKTVASASTGIEKLFSTIFGFLTIVAGLSFLIYFIVGAITWITAGDDAKKVDDAKKFMTNGAIGLIVIVSAYSIIYIVGKVLGLDILNLTETLTGIFGATK